MANYHRNGEGIMDRRIRKSFSSLLMSELLNRQPGFKRSFLIQKKKKKKNKK